MPDNSLKISNKNEIRALKIFIDNEFSPSEDTKTPGWLTKGFRMRKTWEPYQLMK